jgi:predicted DNA-binding transcriptional regulator AlpA
MNNPFETIDSRLSNIEALLLDIKHKESFSTPEADQFLNIQQASELLNLSVPTLYGYSQRREIPVNRRAGRLYFSRHDLIEWVKQGRKISTSDAIESIDNGLIVQKERRQKS